MLVKEVQIEYQGQRFKLITEIPAEPPPYFKPWPDSTPVLVQEGEYDEVRTFNPSDTPLDGVTAEEIVKDYVERKQGLVDKSVQELAIAKDFLNLTGKHRLTPVTVFLKPGIIRNLTEKAQNSGTDMHSYAQYILENAANTR